MVDGKEGGVATFAFECKNDVGAGAMDNASARDSKSLRLNPEEKASFSFPSNSFYPFAGFAFGLSVVAVRLDASRN